MKPTIFFVIPAFIIISCSHNSHSPMDSSLSSDFTVNPSNGTVGVPLDAVIRLKFPKPVDRPAVERNVHLISERGMADSLCPDGNSMGHGMMDIAMMDSMKMHHLDEHHSMRGKFDWNSDGTQCTFTPDSMMTPETRYMIHLGHEIMRMMEDQFGHGEMICSHEASHMSDDMMYHFWTKNTPDTEDVP